VLKQGQEGLQDTVRQLECDQKETLLKCATVWNCNSKNCHPAQVSCIMLSETLEQTFYNCVTIFALYKTFLHRTHQYVPQALDPSGLATLKLDVCVHIIALSTMTWNFYQERFSIVWAIVYTLLEIQQQFSIF
jgi:Utp13 specific WD40 associated domain.